VPAVGEIVLVPFPYSDRLAEKRRPALIVARPKIGAGPDLFWLSMVTSAKHSSWLGDVSIAEEKGTGLSAPCVIRSAKLVSLERVRILRTIGSVSPAVLDGVRAKIRGELGR
jgi:mRNA interferase MazF